VRMGLDLKGYEKPGYEGLQARKYLFIEALAMTGNVSAACLAAGWTHRNTAYLHRKEDPAFAEVWNDAKQIFCDMLESAASERAMGWDEPVFNKDGEMVGTKRVYSDKMMELLLKANRPEKFREKFEHEVTHGGGVIVIPKPLTQDEFEKVALEQQRRHREAIDHNG